MDSSLLIAIAALSTVVLALAIDLYQTRAIHGINKRFEEESKAFSERGSIGEQFGDFLLAPSDDKPESPTNLEVMASLVGRQIAGSFSMGLKGIASGESRTIQKVERAIMEGTQAPEAKALLEFCDRIGIGRDLAGTVYDILEKRGKLPDILKNNGGEQGGQPVW